LLNLFGDYGDKYVCGGMVIRRAKDWYINYYDLLDYKYPSKLASINVKSLNSL